MESILNLIFILAIIAFFPICGWIAYEVFRGGSRGKQLDLVVSFKRWIDNRRRRAEVDSSDARYQALIKLKSLYDDGVIDEREYEREKQRFIGE